MKNETPGTTDDELLEIEARCNAATPGPWEEVAESGEWWLTGPDIDLHYVMSTASELIKQPDVDFIAAARADVPRLVAEVRRQRLLLRDLGMKSL